MNVRVFRDGVPDHNVFRDGKVHVCAERCSTCIFRPGNLMHLKRGRVKKMVTEAVANDSCIPCHQHLRRYGCTTGDAVCRGFYDRHKTMPLQLAERLGLIEEVEL
jgi:hypothetical protein